MSTDAIHKKAVEILGPDARVKLLMYEAIELSHRCKEYLEGKATLSHVRDEYADVRLVGHSLRYIGDDNRPLSEQYADKWADGTKKLQAAIHNKEIGQTSCIQGSVD